jgi:hypothetical protein
MNEVHSSDALNALALRPSLKLGALAVAVVD